MLSHCEFPSHPAQAVEPQALHLQGVEGVLVVLVVVAPVVAVAVAAAVP